MNRTGHGSQHASPKACSFAPKSVSGTGGSAATAADGHPGGSFAPGRDRRNGAVERRGRRNGRYDEQRIVGYDVKNRYDGWIFHVCMARGLCPGVRNMWLPSRSNQRGTRCDSAVSVSGAVRQPGALCD